MSIITTNGPLKVGNDFLLDLAMGAVPGCSVVYKFGQNPQIGNSFEQIWEDNNDLEFLQSADTLDVSSSDNDDTNSGGSGARPVRSDRKSLRPQGRFRRPVAGIRPSHNLRIQSCW